jgi:magnesium transporter
MSCEIDFVIGKNFVITVHYRQIIPLYEIAKTLETNAILKDGNFTKNGGVLVFYIVRQLYDFAARQLDHIQLKINKIEDNIFKGREKEMVEGISYVRCDIIDFQRTIHAHKSVLYSLEPASVNLFGKEFVHYLNNMVGEFVKIKNHLAVIKETIVSLQDTNDSLLTDKANDTMKTLSIMAFLTFPLMLVAALFSMDTQFTPIIGVKGDFWIIVAMMLIGVLGMVVIFKRKKWL